MHSWKQLALLVVAIVGGLGVAAGAQARKLSRADLPSDCVSTV